MLQDRLASKAVRELQELQARKDRLVSQVRLDQLAHKVHPESLEPLAHKDRLVLQEPRGLRGPRVFKDHLVLLD